ncbi:hypothetical protein LSAT2_014159 [Lamellibrachia satsuma]|nr:hypothetical protein LSAT2_014159 [Lamellibrachia satsuma]
MADSDKAIVVVIENERNIPFDIANLVTELLMTVDFTFAIRSDEVSMTEEGYNETVPLAQPIAVACGKLVTDTLKINTDTLLTQLNTIPRNTILNCPKFTKNNETVVDQSWQCNPEELSPTGRCLPCPYGMYYSVKTTTCVNCEKGFFKNSTDRHPCMPCNKLVPLTKREGARSSDECRDKYGRTIKDIQKSLAESSSIIMIIVSAIGILAFLYLTSEIALIFRAKYVAKQKAIELQEMKKQLEQKSQMGEEESVLSLEQPMD